MEDYPTVELLAERSGVNKETLDWRLKNDKKFVDKLRAVKQTLDEDPDKDKPNTKVKLNTAVLSFGIILVLNETKKRYTV